MKEIAKNFIVTSLLLSFFLVPFHISNSSDSKANSEERNFKTVEQILQKRKNYFTPSSTFVPERIVNILIVPGHDDEHSGAEFRGVKEVELNRLVAQDLYNYLNKEPGINVVIAHEKNDYNVQLKNSFLSYQKDIEHFIETSMVNFSKKKKKNGIELENSNYHNTALPEVRFKLYGINWWANKNKIDFIIHVHFNDYPGRVWNKEGKHDGFSMYIPGEHFQNHKLSKTLGQSIFEELKKIRPISSLEYEEKGIIEGYELIAIGPNESLDAGSVLIEYGYIYEDLFQDKTKRDITFDYLAYSTYVGIKKMLNENPFPKDVSVPKTTQDKTTRANLIWQFEKALEGKYPSQGTTLRECPITGYFGDCSRVVK